MDQQTHSVTVTSICEAVGRDAIAQAVSVGKTQISNAITDGRFPARWFRAVKQLCDEAGHPCPLDLFNFAGQHGDGEAERGAA